MSVDISIIIVGYRSQDRLPDCFESILKQQDCSWEVIYVENCPEESAKSMIEEKYSFVKIVEPNENLGFARGCNFGAQYAQGEYLFFLNPDTEIVTGDTLKKLVDFMRTNPTVGLAGPLLMELGDTTPVGREENGVRYGYIGEREIGPQFSHLPGKIAWICGAAMIISKNLFDKIGQFDSRYFMYSDDVDLCLMVRKAGFEIGKLNDAIVMHCGGESTKKIWQKFETDVRLRKAEMLFTKKHYTENQNRLIWKRMKRRYWKYIIINALLFKWKKTAHYFHLLQVIAEL